MYRRILQSNRSSKFNRYICNYTSYTGGEIIHNKLLEKGVTDLFLYGGGAIMPATDPLYNSPIKVWINTHEQSLGHSATGYAKSSGKPGVCMVTSGPGLTNMITPMLDAHNDSTPLIVFSGNVPIKAIGTQAFQECPAIEMTKPFTKWSTVVDDVHNLPYIIDKAFHIANDGKKGCVHIDLPKCISSGIYTEKKRINTFKKSIKKYYGIDKSSIAKTASIINDAKNPIIIVGQGCNEDWHLLRIFAEKANIPITTTIHAVGIFPETNPLSLKFLGMHGNASANISVQNADVIINIGSRFDDRTTGNVEKYAPKAYEAYKNKTGGIIHVNIEISEINKNIKSHYNYPVPCSKFLKTILPFIKNTDRSEWRNQIQQWENKYPFDTNTTPNNKINTQMVIKAINNSLPQKKDWKITTGVGNHQMWAAQFIDYIKPRSLITSGSLGVMGAGIGYSIGAQIANPDSLIINIDGDGSFNHTLSELRTIAKHKLPIKIAVMNDGEMSMVKTWEKLFYEERYVATELSGNPNYKTLAESFGIRSLKCSKKSELKKTVSDFINYPGPILCEFITESDMCYPLVSPGKSLDNMLLYQERHIPIKIDKTQVPS